jgi:lipopolysaccharide transport system permease protein
MRQIFSPFLSPFRFAPILLQFVRRDILGRYRGSLLGMGQLCDSILMLGVYLCVCRCSARWPGAEITWCHFALQLFAE